ncbi:MAG: DUF1553 domain-containing protein, partial [Verrucomicrobia bacterium]|nr:DUF1553 domain-containing protein [Verrucomicrobiota bacterium]
MIHFHKRAEIPAIRSLIAAVLTLSLGMGGQCLASDAKGPVLRSTPFALTTEDRTWWAFQPVLAPSVPAAGSASSRIDQLLEVPLKQLGIPPNPLATRRQIIRRAYQDVIGLPPSYEAVVAFEKDASPDAWTKVVDGLLASPRFGEKWARHWLDLARYAESNGYERDGPKPHAWRYRDYVIRSFNADKPYNQFIREQVAGDELADAMIEAGAPRDQAWRDSIIATGFLRLHVWDDEPDSTIAAEFDDLDDVLSTTGTAVLGMTFNCARCHDHKYDPISQRDYYSLLAFFRSMEPYGQHHKGGGGRGSGVITRPLTGPDEVRVWQETRSRKLQEVEMRLKSLEGDARKSVEAELQRLRDEPPPWDVALAASGTGSSAKPTHILLRGRADAPGDAVEPAFPVALRLSFNDLSAVAPGTNGLGRRTLFARWLTDSGNPLTARVIVNRVWQRYFGSGLVPTPDDFGRTGLPPTHPELLDHLASELMAQGWKLKALHRAILLSEAYRRSTAIDNAPGREKDEDNRWFWRQNLRRLDAEAIRDGMLLVSGRLSLKMEGPSVFVSLPKAVHGTQDSEGKGWGESPLEEQDRRSIYLVVKRALKIPFLEAYDFPACSVSVGQRPSTTIAPQALMSLNDEFAQKQAMALASRVT